MESASPMQVLYFILLLWTVFYHVLIIILFFILCAFFIHFAFRMRRMYVTSLSPLICFRLFWGVTRGVFIL
jgi:hypothetical protein